MPIMNHEQNERNQIMTTILDRESLDYDIEQLAQEIALYIKTK